MTFLFPCIRSAAWQQREELREELTTQPKVKQLANSKIMPAADQRIRFALEAVEKIVCTYIGGPIRTRWEADCAIDHRR